jgi:dihydrofolate reductase
VRHICYRVAASLDGYIAGRNGEADWIVTDPEIDFAALFKQFDTFLVGRRTFEGMAAVGRGTWPGMKTVVFSRTLRQSDYPDVTIVSAKWKEAVTTLRKAPGKDLWLFGGGLLFREFLAAGLVDTVEIAVIPVLLGNGIPMLPPPATQTPLKLTRHKLYRTSGIVLLEYAVRTK